MEKMATKDEMNSFKEVVGELVMDNLLSDTLFLNFSSSH